MTNWKSLFNNPPADDCDICLKIGKNYETYQIKWYNPYVFQIFKNGRIIEITKISTDALYINLNEILS